MISHKALFEGKEQIALSNSWKSARIHSFVEKDPLGFTPMPRAEGCARPIAKRLPTPVLLTAFCSLQTRSVDGTELGRRGVRN